MKQKQSNFVDSSGTEKKQAWRVWYQQMLYLATAAVVLMTLLSAWQLYRYASAMLIEYRSGAGTSMIDSSTKIQQALTHKKKRYTAQHDLAVQLLTRAPTPSHFFAAAFEHAPHDSKIVSIRYEADKMVSVVLSVNTLAALTAYRDALAPHVRLAPLHIVAVSSSAQHEKQTPFAYDGVLEAVRAQ